MGEDKPKEAVLSEGLNMLSEINGFDNAKEVINRLVKVREAIAKKPESGSRIVRVNSNFVITDGKPKDREAFARIIAKINFAQGVSKEDKLVKANRDLLIGRYIGETAGKTQAVIDKALGGLLFIDKIEDFDLDKPIPFVGEFLDGLLYAMEEHRDDLVVILGGEKDAMSRFLNSSFNMTSRFANFIDLND